MLDSLALAGQTGDNRGADYSPGTQASWVLSCQQPGTGTESLQDSATAWIPEQGFPSMATTLLVPTAKEF